MQAFLAILRYDLGQLSHSWLVRIWVALLIVPAVFLIVVAANEQELASETMAAYVGAVLVPLSGLAVAVIASAAVSSESAVIADSILSRSVTRTEYLWAKIVARIGVTLTVYFAVTDCLGAVRAGGAPIEVAGGLEGDDLVLVLSGVPPRLAVRVLDHVGGLDGVVTTSGPEETGTIEVRIPCA